MADPDATLTKATIDMRGPMFCQVGRLGSQYWDWVHAPTAQTTFRMFKHDFFETFAATAWWIIPLVWFPIIGVLSRDALWTIQSTPLAPLPFAATFAAGVLLWTLVEYTLHRFLFHVLFASNDSFFITFHFLLHGQHHKFPLDKGRLVFPPVAGFIMAAPFYATFHSTLPYATAQALMAGALTGYVCYDLIHYYLHHGHPTIAYFRDLKNYHREHHYRNPDLGFGISSKLWDVLFGTILQINKPKRAQ